MKRYFDSIDKVLLILIVTLLSAAYFVGAYWWLAVVMIPVLAISIRFASINTVNISMLVFLTFFIPRLFPSQPPFIVIKISGVMVFGLVLIFAEKLRRAQGWFKFGHVSISTLLYMAAIILISACSLVGWTFFASPNLEGYKKLLPEMPAYLVFVYILLFAITNAAVEEVMWRGVMFTSLESAFGAGLFSNVVQALSFGADHFYGPFLYGWLGVVLTTLFGVLVGHLRNKSQGIFAPWATHAVSDFVILCLVYSFISR